MKLISERITTPAIVDRRDAVARHEQSPSAARQVLRANVLVDSQMRVISRDLDAESMLATSGSELAITRGYLRAACPTWRDQLAALVLDNKQCAARVAGSTRPRATLRVEVRRLQEAGIHSLAQPPRLIVVTDNSLTSDATQVASFYGLTRAESQILNVLCTGRRLNDYACCRKVSINTARTPLKSTLGKLGVRSQVEAMRWRS